MSGAEHEISPRREVKSYVVRGGRLTPSQARAMEVLWPRYGIAVDSEVVNGEGLFGRSAPLVFEIGFGMGDSLLEMAQANPDVDYIGVDVHPPGIGTLLKGIEERGLHNIRVFQGDGTLILRENFADASLSRVQIFFPDPWHKKRHHKRRLIQPDFVELIARKLQPGGILHLATDWEQYAEHMMEVLSASPSLCNSAGQGNYATRGERPSTKFVCRGERLGHGVWDLVFQRQA